MVKKLSLLHRIPKNLAARKILQNNKDSIITPQVEDPSHTKTQRRSAPHTSSSPTQYKLYAKFGNPPPDLTREKRDQRHSKYQVIH